MFGFYRGVDYHFFHEGACEVVLLHFVVMWDVNVYVSVKSETHTPVCNPRWPYKIRTRSAETDFDKSEPYALL